MNWCHCLYAIQWVFETKERKKREREREDNKSSKSKQGVGDNQAQIMSWTSHHIIEPTSNSSVPYLLNSVFQKNGKCCF